MIEISTTELLLMIWGALASAYAMHLRGVAEHRTRLLIGATQFIKHIVQSDTLRDELREVLSKDKDAEFKFGLGD